MATKPDSVHWYYPSGVIPCDLKRIDNLPVVTGVVTHIRSEVTCLTCKERLEADKLICELCRLGSQPGYGPPHCCDPEQPWKVVLK